MEELKKKFQEENGISLEEAVEHIKKWIEEKNLPSAESGITEIEKIFGNSEEVKELKKLLEEARSTSKETLKKEAKVEEVQEGEVYQKDEKMIAAFSYIWFLAVLPLVLKRDSALCQHHGKQGLIFAVFFFIGITFSNFIPFLGYFVYKILSLLQLVVAIYGGIQAFKGKMWKAPAVYKLASSLKF